MARGLGHKSAADEDEIFLRTELLAEDLSRLSDAAAVRAGIAAGVAVWSWFPDCKQIIDAAKDFVDARAQKRRDAREERERLERKALPAPVYADLTTDENRKVLENMYAAMDRADVKHGRALTRHKMAQEPTGSGPPRNPTAADYASFIGHAADAVPGPGLRSPTLIALAEQLRAVAEGRGPREESPYQPYEAPPKPQIGMPYDQKYYDDTIQATAEPAR